MTQLNTLMQPPQSTQHCLYASDLGTDHLVMENQLERLLSLPFVRISFCGRLEMCVR